MATILVVDDEVGIRELLSEILSDEGHRVEVAENAQQARAYRSRQAPDLVLLDIWMPDTDGVTLLKEWATQSLLTMPVIMMSGHATIDTAVEATKIGALDFLEKPITLQKLLKSVQQALIRTPTNSLISSQLRQSTGSSEALNLSKQESSASGVFTLPTANTISFDIPLRAARDAFERAYFEYHLAREKGSMTRIAEKTGLERTHLYRKLRQLGVELSKSKAE